MGISRPTFAVLWACVAAVAVAGWAAPPALAAFNARTGRLTGWNPSASGGVEGSTRVRARRAPHELLAAMLASCVSTTIMLYARARGWNIGPVRVEVVYDSESTPRRVDVTVELPEGLTSEQIRRLRRVADTCPAKRSLQAGFAFEQRLIVAGRAPSLG